MSKMFLFYLKFFFAENRIVLIKIAVKFVIIDWVNHIKYFCAINLKIILKKLEDIDKRRLQRSAINHIKFLAQIP